jgi:glycosyltransferase involved in cell wall biosynthesis
MKGQSNMADTSTIGHTVSVVIASFSEDRWTQLERALTSIRTQTYPVSEIVLVVDHNESLFRRAERAFPDIKVIENAEPRGASGARNSGIALCSGSLLAFLDDDAAAEPDWLSASIPHFADPSVVGVGGKITPIWERGAPRWFPEELLWTVGATYRGMPTTASPVRNVWAGNMVVRRAAGEQAGGFRTDFGKRGDREDFQAEDTEFCLRVAREWPRGQWIYEPAAVAGHSVPPRRSSRRFVVTRCYHEGRNKMLMSGIAGKESTSREKRYFARTLPAGVIRGIGEFLGGDRAALARSLWLTVSALAAIVGVARGSWDIRRRAARSA